jgi:hypothetical protein
MIDDIKHHGSHDIFWCFKYERKTSSYLDIKTNQKSNEMTYSSYHSRVAFTTIYKQLQVDEDALFPPQCVILDLHWYLMTSTQRYGQIEDGFTLTTSHMKNIICTY